jgi:hypothetical protein
MNLAQLIMFFANNDLMQNAYHFTGYTKSKVTVDGLIEVDFVKRHFGEGQLWREIQANVTTYVGCTA